MRYAIFSDIHNHTAALTAVLDHAHEQQVETYICLGDIGIDEGLDLVRQVDALTVFGNWEVSGWRRLSPENQQWVLNLPPVRQLKQFWLTHATPFWPKEVSSLADLQANRYRVSMSNLFPYLHYESETLWEIMAALTEARVPLMFHGHTHRQIAWRFTGNNDLQKLDYGSVTLDPHDTLVIGVGSVGRSMDGSEAAYVIYDDSSKQIEMIRL